MTSRVATFSASRVHNGACVTESRRHAASSGRPTHSLNWHSSSSRAANLAWSSKSAQKSFSLSANRTQGTASRDLRLTCRATNTSFLGKLGRVFKEKAQSDIDRLFKGNSKTRENLAVVDELLVYWNLEESDDLLEELEDTLIASDFGPSSSSKIVDIIRAKVKKGKLKKAADIKAALKAAVIDVLGQIEESSELNIKDTGKPNVLMIIGVNGGGKTTTIGKIASKFTREGAKVMLAAGDTFRAAAREQLTLWAERSGAEMCTSEANKPPGVLFQAVTEATAKSADVLICDTSGRLHNNFQLMDELESCKRAVVKAGGGQPSEVLLVLDGTTGRNMIAQAREFNDRMGVTGLILTKLDGTARGGCVVSIVDELGIPIKFIGVGEGIDDLQTFDSESFVEALFPN